VKHGSPSFIVKLKTHKVKTLPQKIYSRNSQKKNPLIAHDSYFPRIMIVPISESNPKIQCQHVLLKAGKFFF